LCEAGDWEASEPHRPFLPRRRASSPLNKRADVGSSSRSFNHKGVRTFILYGAPFANNRENCRRGFVEATRCSARQDSLRTRNADVLVLDADLAQDDSSVGLRTIRLSVSELLSVDDAWCAPLRDPALSQRVDSVEGLLVDDGRNAGLDPFATVDVSGGCDCQGWRSGVHSRLTTLEGRARPRWRSADRAIGP
jgi:hypothetical protein